MSVFLFGLTLVCGFLIEVDPELDPRAADSSSLDIIGLGLLIGGAILKFLLLLGSDILPINLNKVVERLDFDYQDKIDEKFTKH